MTTTNKHSKDNRFYILYATEHLNIDMDDHGLYCEVISESDETKTHTVRVDESGIAPVSTGCDCPSTKPCKHMRIVDNFYAKIYKTNIEKHKAKQAASEQKVTAEIAQPEPTGTPTQPVSVTRSAVSKNTLLPRAVYQPVNLTDMDRLNASSSLGAPWFSYLDPTHNNCPMR